MKTLIFIFLAAIVILFTGIGKNKKLLMPLTVTALGIGLALTFFDFQSAIPQFEGMLNFDRFAQGFSFVMLFSTLLLVLLSEFVMQKEDIKGDLYGLMLFVLCGAICMVSFDHLVMLFLGIEILSIPLYVLAGSEDKNLRANEAALKYFVMGAFATGILLFGITLVYGATGSFSIDKIILQGINESVSPMLSIGILLLLCGMAFKIGAAPFHFWSPDVYEGSPHLFTAFMASVVKVAGFGAFYRLFVDGLGTFQGSNWGTPLAVVAALTIIVGNFSALMQEKPKRMLAYSSIAHAGYALMAVLGNAATSAGTLLLYMAAYAMATIALFAVFIPLAQKSEEDGFDMFNGLGKTHPFAALTATLGMMSLAGIPPTAGFFGKYLLFTEAFPQYAWLVLIAILGSAVSIAYYLRILMAMYFKSPQGVSYEMPFLYKLVFGLSVTCILLLVLFPAHITTWFS